jgi:transcriptional regulator with XRE-family HTH domain
MTFSDLLRKKRETAGLTQAELAGLAGLEMEIIVNLELDGIEPATFDTCYKISRAISTFSGQTFVLQDLWCAARGRYSLSHASHGCY